MSIGSLNFSKRTSNYLRSLFMIARNEQIGRNWVFTINNYCPAECSLVESLAARQEILKLFVGKEVGEEGTPHLQGYVSFNENTSRTHVERLLGGRAYINKAHGGWRQNYDYCTKQNDILVIKGGPSSAVSNKVPDEALEDLKTLDTKEYRDKWPSVWFYHRDAVIKTMTDYAIEKGKSWDGDLKEKNIWITGPAGCGKSRWAYKQFLPNEQYRKNCNKWWDNYSCISHRLVVIEDLDPRTAQYLTQHIKIWGDRYPFLGECKGSSIQVIPGKFYLIITSNYTITQCFPNSEDQDAILRRFRVINMTFENAALVSELRLPQNILQ